MAYVASASAKVKEMESSTPVEGGDGGAGGAAADARDVNLSFKGDNTQQQQGRKEQEQKHPSLTPKHLRRYDSSAHRPSLSMRGGTKSLKLRPKSLRSAVHSILEYGFYVDVENEDGTVMQKWRRLRSKDGMHYSSMAAKALEVFILFLIIINVILVLAATDVSLLRDKTFQQFFRAVEYFSCAFFTIEYLARLWTCVESPEAGVWGGHHVLSPCTFTLKSPHFHVTEPVFYTSSAVNSSGARRETSQSAPRASVCEWW